MTPDHDLRPLLDQTLLHTMFLTFESDLALVLATSNRPVLLPNTDKTGKAPQTY